MVKQMKNRMLFSVVAVLLVVGVGISFAYFISEVLFSGEGSDITLEPGDFIRVVYDAGDTPLSLNGGLPGDVASKDFTVTVIPTDTEKEATYGIYLDLSNNTFVKCDDTNYNELTNACEKNAQELVYRIKDKDSGDILATGDLTGVTGRVEQLNETKTVDSETTFNYTLEIEFAETNADQNHNTNKTLNGEIVVEFAEPTVLAKDTILANTPVNEGTPDFSKTAQASCSDTSTCEETNGLYAETTSKGTTYYFRGAVDNNWVSFGGFYWRIIRINEDGTLRLIYSGDVSSGPVEEGESTQIQTSAFNSDYNDNMYVGYMYQSNQVHGLSNSSTIKGILDTWYQNNLTSVADKIDGNAGFCGDREPSTSNTTSNGSGGTGTTVTYYGAYIRLVNSKNPTFECENESDLYTISGSENGNKALTYPIGLITADEVAYAGGVYGSANQSYYLYTNSYYWTLSPSYFNDSNAGVFYVDLYGSLNISWVYSPDGVRPVINLKANVTISEGNGTSSNPYVIS